MCGKMKNICIQQTFETNASPPSRSLSIWTVSISRCCCNCLLQLFFILHSSFLSIFSSFSIEWMLCNRYLIFSCIPAQGIWMAITHRNGCVCVCICEHLKSHQIIIIRKSKKNPANAFEQCTKQHCNSLLALCRARSTGWHREIAIWPLSECVTN